MVIPYIIAILDMKNPHMVVTEKSDFCFSTVYFSRSRMTQSFTEVLKFFMQKEPQKVRIHSANLHNSPSPVCYF